MCKYTLGWKCAPAQTRCKFTYAYEQIIPIVFGGYVSIYFILWMIQDVFVLSIFGRIHIRVSIADHNWDSVTRT